MASQPVRCDPDTGAVTCVLGPDSSSSDIAVTLDALRSVLPKSGAPDKVVRVLLDARTKSFRDLEAHRSLSVGLRAVLSEVSAVKLAVVRDGTGRTDQVESAGRSEMRWFDEIEAGRAWLG